VKTFVTSGSQKFRQAADVESTTGKRKMTKSTVIVVNRKCRKNASNIEQTNQAQPPREKSPNSKASLQGTPRWLVGCGDWGVGVGWRLFEREERATTGAENNLSGRNGGPTVFDERSEKKQWPVGTGGQPGETKALKERKGGTSPERTRNPLLLGPPDQLTKAAKTCIISSKKRKNR